jgi:hypothetical protein
MDELFIDISVMIFKEKTFWGNAKMLLSMTSKIINSYVGSLD